MEAPKRKKYIRIDEVLEMLGIGRSAFYAGIQFGRYPTSTRLHMHGSGAFWVQGEIREIAKKRGKPVEAQKGV